MEPTYSSLIDIARDRERYIIPDWQRTEVWNLSRKQLLLDSILRGIKLPKLYFARIGQSENFDVVDGQQRLSVIRDFMLDQIPLADITTEDFKLTGAYCRDLTPEVQGIFHQFILEIDQIHDSTPQELREFFLRLQEGKPLVAQEKLNAVHSNLRDFTLELTQHEFF